MTTPRDRMRALIREARLSVHHRGSVPQCFERAFCAAYHAEGLRAEQMEMFPPDARATVEQIGRGEVFVPSRNAFVPLLPSHLQPQEIDEAGKYLIDHGGDCIRRGGLLRRLSRIMQTHRKAA